MLRVMGMMSLCLLFVAGCGSGNNKPTDQQSTSDEQYLRTLASPELLTAIETTDSLLATGDMVAPHTSEYLSLYYTRQQIREKDTRTRARDKFLSEWRNRPGDIRLMETAWLRRFDFVDRDEWDQLWDQGAGTDSTSAVALFAAARELWGNRKGADPLFFAAEKVQDQLSPLEILFLQERLAQLEDRRGDSTDAIRRNMGFMLDVWQSNGAANVSAVWNSIAKYYLHDSNLEHAQLASIVSSRCAEASGDSSRRMLAAYTGARILARQGRYAAAVDSFELVYDRGEALGSSVWMSAALGRLSLTKRAMGEYRESLDYMIRSSQLSASVQDTVALIRKLCATAGSYREMGILDSALVRLDDASALVVLRPWENSQITVEQARLLYAMQLGHVTRADSLLEVLLARPKVYGKPKLVRNLMLDLMEQGLETGRPDMVYRGLEAIQSSRHALNKLSTDFDARLWFALRTAELHARQGEYDLVYDALAIVENISTQTTSAKDSWLVLQTRGRIAEMTEDLDSALMLFKDALVVAIEMNDPDKIRRSRLRYGQTLLDLGRPAEALDLFASSLNAPEYWSRFASVLYSGLAHAASGRHQEALVAYVRADSVLGKGAPLEMEERLATANSRSLAALGRVDEAMTVLARQASYASALVSRDRQENLRSFYRSEERERAELMIGLLHDHPRLAESNVAAVEALLIHEKVRRSAGADRSDPSASDFAPELIAQGGPVLCYFLGEQRGFAWIGTPKGWSLRELDNLSILKQQARDVISDMARPGREIDWKTAMDLSRELLGNSVGDWDAGYPLRIAGDGVIQDLPWPALPHPSGSGLLIDHGPIIHVTAGLGIGDHGTRTGATPMALILGVDGNGSHLAGSDGDVRLHAAGLEARNVASLFAPGTADVLLGNAANWDAVQSLSINRYDAIHVATHARVSRGRRGGSTLRLSEGGHDRPVTAMEIRDLNLDADLVFLSCCDGARIASDSGSALDSFAQAFLQAGARGVIASSVRIEDEASREMAERFYHHWLSGKSRASALRDAQLEMRDRDQWEHPFYWSFLRILVAGD